MTFNKFGKLFAVSTLVGGAVVSQAAAIDVTSLVTDIGAQAAPIALIGGAVLLVHLAVKAFKWVRSSLS